MSNELKVVEPTKPMESDLSVKRGRPRGDYSGLVNTEVNGHLILEVLEGDRARKGVMVLAVCPVCGTQYRTRLRRLRTEGVKGCRCVRSELFREHMQRGLSKLSEEVITGCWVSRRTMSRKQTAAKFNLPVELVDAAHRKYEAKLQSLQSEGISRQLYWKVRDKVNGKRMTTAQAAEDAGLPVEAVRYLISIEARRVKENAGLIAASRRLSQWVAEKAMMKLAQVSDRQPRTKWSKWIPELTRRELRIEKGRLVGTEAKLYELCSEVDRSALDGEELQAVEGFSELANRTLSNRPGRRRAYVKKLRQEALEKGKPAESLAGSTSPASLAATGLG